MGRLDDKRAVITGATGGIGTATCWAFCREGAEVIGADINADAGKALEAELTAAGFRFSFRETNVTDEQQVQALADHAAADGTVDVLFANAGVILGKPVLQTSLQEWNTVHLNNATSVFLTLVAFGPVMTNPGGSIIVNSSSGATIAVPNMAAYAGAKASAMAFARTAAIDLAPGIRVNCLLPGAIDTPMPRSFVSALPAEQQQAVIAGLEAQHVLKRLGRPEEVANTALFLASDESSFFTAAALTVDGGANAW
ncbi:Dihydroanticapsin 7-dehydrogenase [Paraconexibacter sp. AEG42_29]|uniref:Dihydroanticapsin 7-dehydrogenase n=1 Tax=Paraconexibacter sp. AEG42_29 TaxID=2997339 RepID=A0AAU7AUM2_9ACTN